uniref:Uncharacterized protein n=1 Tax=Neisseria meningitidis alpha275 TaxID=295996 RepID=C6SM50_NEIME|nr:conserved hypothetical protein [Neisseria meningitidis alpha275]
MRIWMFLNLSLLSLICGRTDLSLKQKVTHTANPHLRRTSSAAMLDKVEALLTVGGKHWNYAHAMARRMFGKDKVEYLDDTQLHKLVAALQIAENRKTEKASGDDGVRKS